MLFLECSQAIVDNQIFEFFSMFLQRAVAFCFRPSQCYMLYFEM